MQIGSIPRGPIVGRQGLAMKGSTTTGVRPADKNAGVHLVDQSGIRACSCRTACTPTTSATPRWPTTRTWPRSMVYNTTGTTSPTAGNPSQATTAAVPWVYTPRPPRGPRCATWHLRTATVWKDRLIPWRLSGLGGNNGSITAGRLSSTIHPWRTPSRTRLTSPGPAYLGVDRRDRVRTFKGAR
jgi:hypothetical protein